MCAKLPCAPNNLSDQAEHTTKSLLTEDKSKWYEYKKGLGIYAVLKDVIVSLFSQTWEAVYSYLMIENMSLQKFNCELAIACKNWAYVYT